MRGILFAKLKRLLRNPGEVILLTLLSIIFALILGGSDLNQIKVVTYVANDSEDVYQIIRQIEEETVFTPEIEEDEESLMKKVRNGKSEFGLILDKDDFNIIVGIDSPNVYILEQSIQSLFESNMQYETLGRAINQINLKEEVKKNKIFEIDTVTFQEGDTFIYQRNLHTIFGFSLFFVIFTLMSSVLQILLERNVGLWDRIIMSPVRKWEMYVANFLYSFKIGRAS